MNILLLRFFDNFSQLLFHIFHFVFFVILDPTVLRTVKGHGSYKVSISQVLHKLLALF